VIRFLISFGLVLSAGSFAVSSAVAADAMSGRQLAQQWCTNCHVTADTSAGTVQQGPPSFRAIAQGGLTGDQLRAFLSHPHGAMPDLSLTRAEIDDLIAYFETLR
jgi:cytochrome c